MLAHHPRFVRIEMPAFEEHGIRDGDFPDVVQEAAALQRREIAFVEVERFAEPRRVVRQALAVAVGARVARFDGRTHAHDHGLGRFEVVGEAFEPDERLDPGVQFGGVERLDQEIVAARFDAFQSIAAIRLRRDDDHRHEARRGLIFEPPAEFEAVAARLDQIDQHEIGGFFGARGEGGVNGRNDRNPMPLTAEQASQESDAAFVIVGHEDLSISDHGDILVQNEGR